MKTRAVPLRPLRRCLPVLALLLLTWLPLAVLAQRPSDGFDPGADGSVRRLFVQADGTLLVAGDFTSIGGGARSRLARLRTDGSLDADFSVTIDGVVNAAAALADGRILITGEFTQVNGTAQPSLALLRADGSLDTGFTLQPPGGANTVSTLVRQDDGKIVLGGNFDRLGGHAIKGGVARLLADGGLDTGFAAPLLDVAALATDRQGRTYAAGAIFQAPMYGFVRLRADGALDTAFTLEEDLMWALFESVTQLAVQPDGSILAAGSFTLTRGGQTWTGLLRIRPDGSLDESFRPGPDGAVQGFALQPDGAIVVVGEFTTIGGAARAGVARLRSDGSADTAAVPATGSVRAVAIQADGKIVLGGDFSALAGVARQRLGRLEPDGTLETDFIAGNDPLYPGIGGGGFLGGVDGMALQPDGQLLVVGTFGFIGVDPYNGAARIRPDGSVDATFQAPDARVNLLALQPDGRILVAGEFASIGGQPRPGIARLHADGTLDASFAAPDWSQGGQSPTVTALLLQPDGRVVIAGYWRDGNGVSTIEVVRFQADGAIDPGFSRPAIDSTYGSISALALESDGSLLIGGRFTSVSGAPRSGLARLHADGTHDAGFDVAVDADVMAIQVLPDGRIVIGGWFTTVQGAARSHVARLSAAGVLDAGFAPAVPDDVLLNVQGIVLQADGTLLIGGFADTYFGHVLKLGADGAIDPDFRVTTDGPLVGLAQQADGKLLVAGGFQAVDGAARSGLARIATGQAAVQALRLDADGRLRWTRGGAAPDLRAVQFAYSLDGAAWLPLGAGAPVADGWTLAGTALPPETDLWIRAQGAVSSTRRSPGSLFETVARVRTPSADAADRIFADGFGDGAR
ncbi:delta-60 repeat domain-containing protein [Dokdonella koreensis]|uniref:Delta-60 repeat domain-containing protein n=1 Tax=Dokdonella koreensis DS-123 TaxID=1300342 RepID=A0A160DW31_9GAMM|nr:delta-60 repeat domain-containing protein [Dokdonella koreensis]ANB18815.1 Hypothetical protein I596_2821 [Dokdonella koreensis DS-123]